MAYYNWKQNEKKNLTPILRSKTIILQTLMISRFWNSINLFCHNKTIAQINPSYQAHLHFTHINRFLYCFTDAFISGEKHTLCRYVLSTNQIGKINVHFSEMFANFYLRNFTKIAKIYDPFINQNVDWNGVIHLPERWKKRPIRSRPIPHVMSPPRHSPDILQYHPDSNCCPPTAYISSPTQLNPIMIQCIL